MLNKSANQLISSVEPFIDLSMQTSFINTQQSDRESIEGF